MSGHAGFTYGFDLSDATSGSTRGAILKMGPQGVARRGAADIFRQATLLSALRRDGIPVPEILWADEAEVALGAPYIVMAMVPGRQRLPLLEAVEPQVDPAELGIWREGVSALMQLDDFPALERLGNWQSPLSCGEEFASWEATLRKATVPGWIDLGLRTRDALAERMPRSPKVALVHGDFQPANLMSAGGTLTSIIDWDLAHIGSSGLDAGWLMMWADREYWGPHWQTWSPYEPGEIARLYLERVRIEPSTLHWFHAHAGYRFGAITCLNLRLHRNGKRPDPIWELFALDVPRLFARARQLAELLPRT